MALDAQLAVAQTDAATALAQLMRSGADATLISDARAQLASLAALKRQLETASPSALPALQAEIAACVSATTALARDASGARAEGGTHAVDEAEARSAARKTIANVQQALFKDRVFDPYLQFASKEDEEGYRKRETERQALIEKELAKDTVQGDLNALRIQREQWRDAGDHGANRSPDYARIGASIDTSRASLSSALEAEARKAKAQSSTDPLADLVSSADVSKFKESGVVVADQNATGHGITRQRSADPTPSLPG